MDLQDKVIAITGGGQGLGRSMAVSLAGRGAKIALIDLNQERLDESIQLCKDAGGDACAYIANIADEDQVISAFDNIVKEMGNLHGLINNAGILRDGLMVKAKDGEVTKRMSLAEWQAVIDVNLTGVFLCGREAATKMIELGTKGCIINISSVSKAGNLGQTNYSAAKAGVAAMAVTWAKELSRYGIRAAAIAPGFIATEMVASMKPEALEKMAAMIPMGRLGEPEEIGKTAAYILENDYFTGRVIEMDGGIRI
ncbi:3-oxoacyl-[acyl-carrier-protein] reductase FabG [Sinobacterium norvegicum]|uniref:3-oxoacyl-[acyl-carrier-protein] reductase FabG n=1 Tax=Sinobacterium norvegicum TaxID=1641715 RepID=A0ABN8EIY5_9GAMM|nr:SDR family oxidoreductase [Sinobacterium norvegicum]CAH0992398.1 3-oxoacyl-[acyl-carrier-protein] reductase FabG [Sinobacterium norvegicum]